MSASEVVALAMVALALTCMMVSGMTSMPPQWIDGGVGVGTHDVAAGVVKVHDVAVIHEAGGQ